MTLSSALLKASHIGIRDLKMHLSEKLKTQKPLVVTDHGRPTQVIIPYGDIVELAEILEELRDPQLIKAVQLSRKNEKEALKESPAADLFHKIRALRNKF